MNKLNENVKTWKSKIQTRRLKGPDDKEYFALAPEDDSPYPEVRASVPNIDDTTIPQNTLRMWTIGIIMSTLGSALTVLFSLHSPIFTLSPYVASIAAWPLGRLWDRYVPRKKRILGVKLNPGSFNVKEHALITIMANVAFGTGAANIVSVIVAMEYFYGLNFGFWFQFCCILATQAIGFSIAGFVRRILVYPASMIWPVNLVTSTFLTNIHVNVNHICDGWRITRLKFFFIILLGSIVWSFFPQYIAPALSFFNIGPWIAPDNVVINQMFGSMSGLGMIPFTFDWNQISGFMGSPLIPPWFAVGNVLASIVVVYWLVATIIQYSNVFYGHYLPMGGSDIWDRFQQIYDVSKVLGENHSFDNEKYVEYSPLYFPTTYVLSYCMSFAAIVSTIVHTVLYDGKDIIYYWTHSRRDPDDVHMRLIKRYKDVPEWWFCACFLIFFGLAVTSIKVWPTELPVWALIVALALSVLLIVPIAMVFALTNIRPGLSVLTELLIGYIVPGKPIAMMMFKTYGYISNVQAITFLQDMKLAHYLKIAPRVLFTAQLVATIWGSLVQLAVIRWAQGAIDGLCTENQSGRFTCPQGRVFYNSSVVWGVVGAARQFTVLYKPTFWFFVIGAVLPAGTWLYVRKHPKSVIRLVHWPVFFNGSGYLPPATVYQYMNYCIVGTIFGFMVKKKWFNWWAKYNYSLSAGLDLGLCLGSLLIFLIFQLGKVEPPEWWGTVGAFENSDSSFGVLKKLKPGEWFGVSQW